MLNLHKKLLGEVPTTYNGGGKSGGGQTAVAKPISTTTIVGDQLSNNKGNTFDQDEENERKARVDKAAKGVRGLRIPLTGMDVQTPMAPLQFPKTAASGSQL